MSQPEWDALVEEVRDLRTRVARMEAAMGTSAPSAARPALPVPDLPEVPGILESPTSLLPVLAKYGVDERKEDLSFALDSLKRRLPDVLARNIALNQLAHGIGHGGRMRFGKDRIVV